MNSAHSGVLPRHGWWLAARPSGPATVLAEFDRTQQLDNARDTQAKFDDLSHQVEQRQAQNRAASISCGSS